ncbi:APC family permease [Streptomyces rochei]|uniref:APC family permease n=1 Tax=Streptomyces vinaceusdrappus TaxID=67376 RepID=A0ABY6BTI2_9ACTN|nr:MULTISPECIES: APC family permease [Streptomyces]MBU8547670.1 APC family permease [Streptomyces sp. Osf17]MBU8554438.1 APC family permease [Streptomyces sp. Babs14]MCC8451104.1 APC family permease [Streptomyces rochei]RSS28243.1 APC family permease [Streptomyces sp. WAC08452]UXI76866.1 APC family permease [Streptomyces vinaceusdrappus]
MTVESASREEAPQGADPQHPGAAGSDDSSGLRRGSLGVADIAFFVVSAAAPLTVMAGVAPLAIGTGGIGAPVGYLLAGITLALFAVGFTAMTRHVRSSGGFYAFITRGLGRPAGFGAATLALLAYNGMQIGVYGLLATGTQDALEALWGIHVPWPAIALAGVFVIWYLGYRSIEFGAKVLGVLLLAETGILVLLAGGVLLDGGAEGVALDSFTPGNVLVPGTGAVLAFAFAAFTGFESTAIYRREARDPNRTIPRATYIAVGFLGLFYAFSVWIVIQAYGSSHIMTAVTTDPVGLFFTATTEYVGGWAADLMHVFIVTSIIASQLAFHNAINRYGFSLAREGVLPEALGRVHPKHRSPYVAGIAQSVLALICVTAFAAAGADPYRQLLLWMNTPGSIGLMALQAITAVAVLRYFRRVRHQEGRWRTLIAPLASAVLMTGAMVLIISKIGLMTGASFTTNTVLVSMVPVAFVVGLLLSQQVRRSRPEVYTHFAREPDEEDTAG